MAGRFWRDAGGTFGLLTLLDEHQEAVEYDLLPFGLRIDDLGTEALTWRDLLVIVRMSPRGSALHRARDPHHEWTIARQLQAAQLNEARRLAWLYEASHSKRTPPEPVYIRLPWEDAPTDRSVFKGDTFDSPRDAADWYAARFPERAAEVHQIADRMTE